MTEDMVAQLTELVLNRDLEDLENRLAQFNIFEAIGLVRQEVLHSNFLAFLLDPKENHGLGDTFAKRLLQKVLLPPSSEVSINPINIDLWDLSHMVVQREPQHVDILLTDENAQLAVIIENKIDSTEHDDQLQRYWQLIKRDYRNTVGIYLTPGGDSPEEGEPYMPVSYGQICDVLDDLVKSRQSTIGTDVLALIQHYIQLLRRRIMDDSDIADLCRKIYAKHQRALDRIFEERPDRQAAIKEVLETLVTRTSDLELVYSKKALYALRSQSGV